MTAEQYARVWQEKDSVRDNSPMSKKKKFKEMKNIHEHPPSVAQCWVAAAN
jgi:hypothetical protein